MSTPAATPRSGRAATARPEATLSPDELGAWRSFLQAHARVTRRLDEELQAAHGLSLAEYDTLLQIARSPGRRVRMNVLADRVLLSRSGITRLVDRLEGAGSVERVACSSDARGQEAVLTRTGLDRLRAAGGTHLDGVRRYFLDQVDPADLAVLERTLGGIAVAVAPEPPYAHEGCPRRAHLTPRRAGAGPA